MPEQFHLEVCVDRVEDAEAAVEAGATRIEMNQALRLDGLTPTVGQCEWLVARLDVPIIAMLRPHSRDFLYSVVERTCLLRDCELLLATGIHGIAFGSLDSDQNLDLEIIQEVIRICQGNEFVLHRVFDTIKYPMELLPRLIDCGVTRILTSGGAGNACEGVGCLQQLHQKSRGLITIMPGGGVRADKIGWLHRQTECRQFHGSFSAGGGAPNQDEIRKARGILKQIEVESGC